MTETELRMLRHLAGVMAEAAAGIIAIIEAHQPEIPAGPRYLGDDEPPQGA